MSATPPLPESIAARTVPQLLQAAVRAAPERTALVAHSAVQGRELVLSYAELAERSAALAGALADRGVALGDRVALMLTNEGSVESHVAYHAVHHLGAINVPINTFYVERELRHALTVIEPAAIVLEPAFAGLVASSTDSDERPALLEADAAPQLGEPIDALIEGADAPEPTAIAETDDADWIFTSGTTGPARAVALTHGNSVACGYESQAVWDLAEESVYQSSAPFFTSTGCHTNQLACLAAACTNVVDPAADLEQILERALRRETTSLFLLTALLAMMFRRLDDGRISSLDTGRVVRMTYGGQTMPRSFHERVQHELADERGIDLAIVYGLTEGGTSGLMLDPEDHAEAVRRHGDYGMPIGRRGWNEWVDWRVADDDGGEVPPGQVGEILLRAPSVMSRYVDDEEATLRTLADGWLHTGDLATIDEDGFVYFVDRAKLIIRRGGMNIAPAEVESVAIGHPAVAEAAAVGRPNPVLGEDVHLIVVLGEGADVSSEELLAYCAGRLAEYKMPRAVSFIDEMPRTALGKLARAELADIAAGNSG